MAVKVKNAAESMLVNEVIRAGWRYAELTRVNTGNVKTDKGYRFSTGTPAGYPDISGYRRKDGRAVFLECKVEPNKPTEQQIRFIEKARQSGCLAGICYSVRDALEIIME